MIKSTKEFLVKTIELIKEVQETNEAHTQSLKLEYLLGYLEGWLGMFEDKQ